MAEWNAKANEVFLAAAEVESPAERQLFLDQHCGNDAGLRAQVESLLTASAKVGSFLNKPAAQALLLGGRGTADYEPIAERPGTVIGPYKLKEQIGEGGMGLVFVAEQQEPVRRKVALKIIKPGMDSKQVIARFEAERQTLAMMEHQNIAKVFDAGTTESGRPYFMMELVHGVPITEYCDANKLTPRQRLELFVPVCQAIQHAHQKGIIHRDIKPSNVLVTMYDDKPVPKVIDFGVAKAIEQRLTEKSVYTQFGTLVGTFEYMSPEQAGMNAFGVDTRSDIYALGVLLYELLTGTTPLERQRFREAAFDEIRRIINEEEPQRPSVRLSTSGTLAKVAAARKTEPAKLSRLMRGELDWVVMKCLEKDRSRRYDTASNLARDVERFLKDEPVEARPPSAWYRLRKAVRRNRGKVGAGIALLLLLLVGLAGTSIGLIQARREAERALAAERKAKTEKENTQATLEFVWEDVLFQASPWMVADRDLKLRDMIDRAAARVEAGTGRPPLVEATLRRMLGAIYTEMGEPDIGKRFLEEALIVQSRELAEADPELLETNYLYGRCLCILNRYDDAAAILGRNVELRRQLKGIDNKETIIVMRWAALCYAAQGRYAGGDRLFREGLDALSRLPEYQAVGRVLYRYYWALSLAARGDLWAGEDELKGCLEDARQPGVSKDFPPVIGALRNLAWVYLLGDDPARAEPLVVEALAHMRAVMGDRHPYTLGSIWVLSRIYLAQGRYAEAGPLIEEVVEGSRRRPEEGIPRLACGLGIRGQLLVAQKKYAEAEPPLRECLALWEKRLPHGGYISFSLSKRGAAREYAFAKCLLGASLLSQKEYDKAKQWLLDGYDGLKAQPEFPEDAIPYAHRSRVDALTWLVQLYDDWNKPAEAAKWRRELEKAKGDANAAIRKTTDLRGEKPRLPAGDPPAAEPMETNFVAAIREGDRDVVGKLLDNGADVNSRDVDGNTALILASLYAGPECVELLLKKGADANAANKAGATALIRAATEYEKTRLLVAAGAKVDVRTADLGNTPLILAARRAGNSKTVKLLLERGAHAKAHNAAGVTPVISAAAGGDVETVKLLLDAGADVNEYVGTTTAAGRRTPLMWAAFQNDLPMIRLLLTHGADPNRSTSYGNPLSHACWSNSFEAAELLIAHGANINATDFAGFTPLHWAAGTDSPKPRLVKLLLAKGADPNATGGGSVGAFGLVPQTPRLIAEKRGHTLIVDALIAAGAKDAPRVAGNAVPKRPLPERLDNATLIAAAEKALGALQTTAAKSRESFLRHASKQDCVSCHQQYLPMAAVGHARNRSVRFDQVAARAQIALLPRLTRQTFNNEFLVQTVFHPDPAHTFGYASFGLAAEKVPPSAGTDVRVHHLVTLQSADGRWVNTLPRPPMQSGDVSATALAIHAIKHYGWPGRRKEFTTSIERGRQWLWKVKAETTEEAVFQLLGLHWAGEPAEKLAASGKALLQQQRKDGGWAQLPTLESDAYATGEVLYALARTVQLPKSDPAWQRGLRFLLERQEDDGTWRVARRAYPFQPTMDSGFPYGRDSWISAAGTSWAVLAMTEALPPGTTTEKPPVVAKKPKNVPVVPAEKIDFAKQIKPLLERSCVACHGANKQRSNFRLDSREAMLKGGNTGSAVVVPGKSAQSTLPDYVSGRVEGMEMPPMPKRNKFAAFTKEEAELVRAWIAQGAIWPKDVVLSPARSEAPR